jgi:hypothetical protein
MNAWHTIIIAAAATCILVGCKPQPEGPAAEHGLCFIGPACGGNAPSGVSLPTREQCKAAGGNSWLGGASSYCTPL